MGNCINKKIKLEKPSDLNKMDIEIGFPNIRRMQAQRHINIDFDRLKKISDKENHKCAYDVKFQTYTFAGNPQTQNGDLVEQKQQKS